MDKHEGIKIGNPLKEPHYRSIIRLLWLYPGGLQQKHFRYALMKDPQLKYTKDMEKFFASLPEIVYKLLVKMEYNKGEYIATQKDLNYYLRYLQENKIIKKINRKKPFRYALTSEFWNEFNKTQLRDYIESWEKNYNFNRDFFYENYAPSFRIERGSEKSNEKMIEELSIEPSKIKCPTCGYQINGTKIKKRWIPPIHGGFLSSIKSEDWILYGLPVKMHEKFTESEIKKIAEYLRNIEENLWKIMELKYEKTKKKGLDFFYHNMRTPEDKFMLLDNKRVYIDLDRIIS